MNREYLASKTIAELISDNMIVVDLLNNEQAEEINSGKLEIPQRNFGMYDFGNDVIVVDYEHEFVMHLKNEEIISIFWVYELRRIFVNATRKLVFAVGNGHVAQYWFDNCEYEKENW
jgi:hypothetical protein